MGSYIWAFEFRFSKDRYRDRHRTVLYKIARWIEIERGMDCTVRFHDPSPDFIQLLTRNAGLHLQIACGFVLRNRRTNCLFLRTDSLSASFCGQTNFRLHCVDRWNLDFGLQTQGLLASLYGQMDYQLRSTDRVASDRVALQ